MTSDRTEPEVAAEGAHSGRLWDEKNERYPDVEGLVERLDKHSEFYRYRPVSRDEVPALEEITRRECDDLFALLDEAARSLQSLQSEAAALRVERDQAIDARDDFRERLHDLVMIDAEEWATGGGPGFKERKEKAWSRAREPFEP